MDFVWGLCIDATVRAITRALTARIETSARLGERPAALLAPLWV
jgi:hypothetical protein